MKTKISLLIALMFVGIQFANAQDKQVYSTTMLEIPFTWANSSNNGVEYSGPVRFAPFFNLTNYVNVDFSEKAGFLAGLSVRNLGYIYDQDPTTRIKVRSYNLGIPLGIKLGDMDKGFVYLGYEVEFPFNWQQKTFINEQKTKLNKWFSDRTPIQQSVMVGLQLPYGANIKFKYYFTNFYNQDYTESDANGNPVKPYENFEANIFYISLNLYLLRNVEFYY